MTHDRIDIYYFTGTGNTLHAVKTIQTTLEARGKQVHLFRMEKTDPSTITLDHMIGLAFPVACFSTYPLVWRFIEGLPNASGTLVFMIDTMALCSGGIVGPLKSLLQKKGYQPVGAREFIMPSNYPPRIKSKEENEKKINQIKIQAKQFAEKLLEQKTVWRDNFVLSHVICWLSRLPWPWRYFSKKVTIDRSHCNQCGLCARLCPTQAITMNDYPEKNFSRCEGCMRCAAYCPQNTILIGGSKMRYQAFSPAEFLKTLEEKTV